MAQEGLLGTGVQSRNRNVRRSARRAIVRQPAAPPPRAVRRAPPVRQVRRTLRQTPSRPKPRQNAISEVLNTRQDLLRAILKRRQVTGRVSWFGGPHDTTTGPRTADGSPITKPGIAVYNRRTLGGYWHVELPKQRKSIILKQTDLGPSPWTNRKVDITYSALPKLGFTEKSFPTDAPVRATYLGKRL